MSRLRYYLSLAAAFGLALLGYLFRRRGETIEQLETELREQPLRAQTQELAAQLTRDQEGSARASEDYDSVRRRNSDVLTRYGVGRSDE